MQNRIDNCFSRLRQKGEKAFIAYIGAGDPTLDATVELGLALEEAGTDILELGVPFSDPLADGIVNQLAAQRALASGATVAGVLDCVRALRRRSDIPVVLYTYLNPIYQFGLKEFYREAFDAGVDGLLILDLPAGESGEERAKDLHHITLIAPTTPIERARTLTSTASGFVYYVSRESVTGVQAQIAESLAERVGLLRTVTSLPIAVGFGISTPEQVREVASHADGVVVGSAIVKRIAALGADPSLCDAVAEFVLPLAAAARSSR